MKSFLNHIVDVAKAKVADPVAQKYLHDRGVTQSQIEALGIGYYPEEVWPPKVKGDSEDIQGYLTWCSKGYRLRGKLLFPMTNAMGFLGGIQIRSPNPEKKDYSKYYLARSKVDALFFGTPLAMPHIWKSREVYLCEGIFDFFPLQRAFPNTLCTGTANVGARQVEFLHRYVDSINVVFDSDWGGKEFFKRFTEGYGSGFKSVQRIEVRGKDVSEMWAALGEERFQKSIRSHILL